MAYIPKMPRWR